MATSSLPRAETARGVLPGRMRRAAPIALLSALLVGGAGCFVRTGVGPEPVYVEQPPPNYATYPTTTYDGRPVYYVDNRWYYRDGSRWAYYRNEPAPLSRHRRTLPPTSAPPAYGPGVAPAPVARPPGIAPPATRVQ